MAFVCAILSFFSSKCVYFETFLNHISIKFQTFGSESEHAFRAPIGDTQVFHQSVSEILAVSCRFCTLIACLYAISRNSSLILKEVTLRKML